MASLNFDPKEIAPLLKKFGIGEAPGAAAPAAPAMSQTPDLGQAPSAAAPDLAALPPPPLKPKPAQAGFNEWSADPMNQKKVADGITLPGQPIVPPAAAAQFGGVAPMTPARQVPPSAPAAPMTQAADMAANPDAYQKPSLQGRGWGRTLAIGGIGALQSLAGGLTRGGNPLAGMQYINEQVQHDQALPQTNAGIYDVRNIKPLRDAAALADVQSQTTQRIAAANKSDATAEAGTPFTMSAEQAAAIGQPELVGMKTNTTAYTKLLTGAGSNDAKVTVGAGNAAARVTVGAGNNATAIANNQATNKTRETVEAMANKTHLLMTAMNNSTSRANNENTNSPHSVGTAGLYKVPADVTKRAALATNVLENADGVQEIIGRRQDIVGAMGGRYTNVQQMIGSDDPDIQALGVRVHNIALASNGAHGVRSSEAVAQTENEIFNNFKTGPKGIAGSLAATRSSVQTFLNDEKSFQTTGSRSSAGGAGVPPPAGTAPQGEPANGTRKNNSHGDPVIYLNHAWGPA